ncbi:L,D-transpeptidase [Geosporobacter ferrireducens]|uniref:L,D-TPase catalytic domain-containing protein n=1 Tax=Geosporobacter ferrireducens TaxID=1424294 RepID=A0A1D8GPA8_9FIRM|nr:L,D-transpeptidase [Geosporobacter ferrireducens]AOT72725.1 hypothetical protein Gferi_26105 [Geosporobacter ferrireducens]
MVKKCLSILFILAFITASTGLSFGFGQQSTADKRIVINIASRTLTLFNGDRVEKIYPVAVGKPSKSTQTPTGNYRILNKIINPYYSKLKIPGGSPSNPLGIRWLGFRANYGIHGNSDPKSIGTTASAGCVRMYNYDVKELFERVVVNTKVDVIYSLFHTYQGTGEKPTVLMVYPDVYKKEKDLKKAIVNKLIEEKMKDDIEETKIQEAVKFSKNRPVALSKQWVLLVNGHDMITDIITDNQLTYISEGALKEYFGIVAEKDADGKVKILGKDVEVKSAEEKNYISIEDIKTMVGGHLEKNNILKNLWYDVSFLKLNGVFLESNQSGVAAHNPVVPVKVLSEVLGHELGKMGKLQWINKIPYMDLVELQDFFQIEYNFYSYNKQIELLKNPVLYFGDKTLPAKYEEGRVLINLADLEMNNLVVKDQWIELNDLEMKYDILYDKYKLNIRLSPKPQEKVDVETDEAASIVQ